MTKDSNAPNVVYYMHEYLRLRLPDMSDVTTLPIIVMEKTADDCLDGIIGNTPKSNRTKPPQTPHSTDGLTEYKQFLAGILPYIAPMNDTAEPPAIMTLRAIPPDSHSIYLFPGHDSPTSIQLLAIMFPGRGETMLKTVPVTINMARQLNIIPEWAYVNYVDAAEHQLQELGLESPF